MSAKGIEKLMVGKVAVLNTKELCEAFELTNDINDDTIPMIRGLLMDELEKRDPTAFDAWIEVENPAEMDYPSKFFN
jgi:hypothetical protein